MILGAGVFDQHIGSKWHTAAFGMSGDTALNLEWRLQHGELPGLDRAPRVVVVLCGTNDLRDAKVMRDSTKALREAATAAEAILSAAPAVVARCGFNPLEVLCTWLSIC